MTLRLYKQSKDGAKKLRTAEGRVADLLFTYVWDSRWWGVTETALALGMAGSTAREGLERLFGEGLVERVEVPDVFGRRTTPPSYRYRLVGDRSPFDEEA